MDSTKLNESKFDKKDNSSSLNKNNQNDNNNDDDDDDYDVENLKNFDKHRESIFLHKKQIEKRRFSEEENDKNNNEDDKDDEDNNNNNDDDINYKFQSKNIDKIPKSIKSINHHQNDQIKLRPILSFSSGKNHNDKSMNKKRVSYAHTNDILKFDDQSPSTSSTLKDENFKLNLRRTSIKNFMNNQNDDNKSDDIESNNNRWDSFKSISLNESDSSLNSKWSHFFLKLLKLSSYLITLLLVLITSIIAKFFLHLISTMTRIDKNIQICKENLFNDDDKYDKSTIIPYYTNIELKSNERIAWIWMLYFVLISPEIILFLRCIHLCLFKKFSLPDLNQIFIIILTNSFEVIGISLFVYIIIPSFNSIIGLMMTNSFLLIPSFIYFIQYFKINEINNDDKKLQSHKIMKFLYLFAYIFQIISLILWPILLIINNLNFKTNTIEDNAFDPKRDEINCCWIIPISCILITLGYWENFLNKNDDFTKNDNVIIDKNKSKKLNQKTNNFKKFNPIRLLYEIKNISQRDKFAIYLFVSIWKCFLHLIIMLIIQGTLAIYYDSKNINNNNDDSNQMLDMIKFMFTNFSEAFEKHPITLITNIEGYDEKLPTIYSDPMLPIWFAIIQIIASFVCYQTINFVCQICIQPFGFGLPITLSMPFTVSLVQLLSRVNIDNQCYLSDYTKIFDYTFFNVSYDIFDYENFVNYLFWINWIITFLSQIIITNHIWFSSKERLASTNKLFMIPLYTTAFIDQSLMLNRRRNDENNIYSLIFDDQKINRKLSTNSEHRINYDDNNDNDVRVYACATVWHETEDELVQMLQSIMRIDKDQCIRSVAVDVQQSDKRVVDFYHFEAHLLVDDAFKKGKYYDKNVNDLDINEYVETLIGVLDKAAQSVHKRFVKIRTPEIFLTPYGGRIEWILPGGNKLIAHLKDKSRIRHRKRWSQVMYMYYLLGYKICQEQPDRKDALMKNTYLLALDGDINFRPEAVLMLIDLMRKNNNLGAACGRVHPVGIGPMAWYQKFEYAISHWLQKATEHVFGCVLCSPGCFSLFRASALADTNIMNRYTTKPTEAVHYVQYDQGEDRWLCTLLLQQGWAVSYSAASDSFTHCPEVFDEFFVQRRRWIPSTMANIFDLLKSYKKTVQANEKVSSLYILYQAGLMLGSILSPGTIILMLVGAVTNSFGLDNKLSFYINVIPVLIFVVICFFTNNKIQILVAQIFSTFYVMIMLAVLVSIGIEIANETIFSPSVVFFVGMMAIFIFSAIIHPQEFFCIFPVVIYMLMIPSMYLLLTLYSIINLNVIVWGTRENPQVTKNQKQQPKQIEKKQKENFIDDVRKYFHNQTRKLQLFNCVCCGSSKNDEEITLLHDLKNSMQQVRYEMDKMKKQNSVGNNIIRRMSLWNERRPTLPSLSADKSEKDPLLEDEESKENENEILSNESEDGDFDIINSSEPRWINNENLKKAKVYPINNEENEFWVKFIEKYLKPLDKNEEHENKVKLDLIKLRNQAFFAMAVMNIIYVLFVYLIQLHKDVFNFEIVISKEENGTKTILVDDEEQEIPLFISKKITMDPVGLMLIIFFGSIIIIQFIGMILHRFVTLTHLLAFTDIDFFDKDNKDRKIGNNSYDKNVLRILKKLLKREDLHQNENEIYFDVKENLLRKLEKLEEQNKAKEFIKEAKVPNVSKMSTELSRRSSIYFENFRSYLYEMNDVDEMQQYSNDTSIDMTEHDDIEHSIFSRGSSPIRVDAPISFQDDVITNL